MKLENQCLSAIYLYGSRYYVFYMFKVQHYAIIGKTPQRFFSVENTILLITNFQRPINRDSIEKIALTHMSYNLTELRKYINLKKNLLLKVIILNLMSRTHVCPLAHQTNVEVLSRRICFVYYHPFSA